MRNFIHVDDVLDICMFCAKNNLLGTFNVGTGTPTSFFDVATNVAMFGTESLGLNVKVRKIKNAITETGQYQAFTCTNITKLRAAGYKREMLGIELGIKKYFEWLQENK